MLTYCTNIHPGEAWADVRRNLSAHALAVKRAISPQRPFPLGLRVSGRAARELGPDEAKRFRDWCESQGCFVPTLNGFPHGRFHGPGVKRRVYLPDWRDPERAAYTRRLADLLAGWLPAGVAGSISSVPVAFAADFDAADWPGVRRHLLATLEHLRALRETRGADIVLALEPEPGCVLDRTADLAPFLERMALPPALADRLGLCFDCCHQAVGFEDPLEALERVAGAGVRIAKVQVSSSLRAVGDEIPGLARFDEPSYLHQVVARRRDGSLRRHADLPELFAAGLDGLVECRVHFHVPIFAAHLGACGTTRDFLERILPRLDPSIPLEVETYSFDVLPAELRATSVSDSIARELLWVTGVLDAAHRRP